MTTQTLHQRNLLRLGTRPLVLFTGPRPPFAPPLRAAVAGRPGGSVTARWCPQTKAAGSGTVRYQVRATRFAEHGRRTTTSARLDSSTRSLTMALARGTYRFQVRAISKAGASAWSAPSNKVRAR